MVMYPILYWAIGQYMVLYSKPDYIEHFASIWSYTQKHILLDNRSK
jgi:hypothetical protein